MKFYLICNRLHVAYSKYCGKQNYQKVNAYLSKLHTVLFLMQEVQLKIKIIKNLEI